MSARLKAFLAKKAQIVESANKALDAALDRAGKEGGGLTEAERAAQATFDTELADINSLIEAEQLRAGRIAPVLDAGPVPPAPTPSPAPAREARAGWGLGGMLHAVAAAPKGSQFVDPRLLAAASGAQETVDSDGGYLVQQDWGGTLMSQTYDTGVLVKRVRRQPIGAGANGVRFNLLDETSRATGSRFGALQVFWAAEADQFTSKQPKFRRVEMLLKKLIGLMYVTDELMADAVALEGYVNEWFPQEFGFMLDDAIFQGTGAGKPLGVLNAPALVTIAKEGGQAAGSIVASNIEKMYAACPAYAIPNAAWFINVACWPQLFQLYHAIGTGGVPLYLPSGSVGSELTGAPFGTLLGRPVIPIEQAAAPGTVGDITLMDLSRYMLIDKGPIQTAASIHVKFLTDEMAFRWVLRIDGQPIPNSPITPFKGSQTLSPFVALAAR
jgi:HK97 family phage major capsid protein